MSGRRRRRRAAPASWGLLAMRERAASMAGGRGNSELARACALVLSTHGIVVRRRAVRGRVRRSRQHANLVDPNCQHSVKRKAPDTREIMRQVRSRSDLAIRVALERGSSVRVRPVDTDHSARWAARKRV